MNLRGDTVEKIAVTLFEEGSKVAHMVCYDGRMHKAAVVTYKVLAALFG